MQAGGGKGELRSPEDVLKVDVSEDGAGGDDEADALRYLVATSPLLPAGASVAG
jgi:hypothetical protein